MNFLKIYFIYLKSRVTENRGEIKIFLTSWFMPQMVAVAGTSIAKSGKVGSRVPAAGPSPAW